MNKSLKGVQVCRGALQVNHLLFAYDSLIFYKVESSSSLWLPEILKEYALALGQCINLEKSAMIFSKNVKREVQTEIESIWGSTTSQQYEKYLGLSPNHWEI